jgi:predicted anti-sigma-YlaC factor YlaD
MSLRIPLLLTCRDVAVHATDYMEGTLARRDRLAVRLHLALCRMCRTYLDQLRRTAALLRDGRLAPPPADVEARILAGAKSGPR